MINHVRNTVLTVLNKENRGFITPAQFNSYAKHAQQVLFNQYFSEYSRLVTMKNSRRLSREQGNKLSIVRANIDKFTKTTTSNIASYRITKPTDMYTPISLIYSNKIMEYIPKQKQMYLEASNVAGPSTLYPGYCDEDDFWYVKPNTLTGSIKVSYIRNLVDPKWTYVLVGENPVFNPSAADYKDFELGADDETKLIIEILKLTGVTIREAEVAQAAAQIDAVETQKENV